MGSTPSTTVKVIKNNHNTNHNGNSASEDKAKNTLPFERQADWQMRLVSAEVEVSEKQLDRLEVDVTRLKSQNVELQVENENLRQALANAERQLEIVKDENSDFILEIKRKYEQQITNKNHKEKYSKRIDKIRTNSAKSRQESALQLMSSKEKVTRLVEDNNNLQEQIRQLILHGNSNDPAESGSDPYKDSMIILEEKRNTLVLQLSEQISALEDEKRLLSFDLRAALNKIKDLEVER
ncbi:uncharacterized protein TRIADDRAFT_60385 [Trichoplax adhaerens]|uniref:Uncharacterized protein n=1 Tax=Trichoplax adhaerens TaxID=10228 RepID=B3S829_TRIAD|nr:hypothetical protein TRIADDRAFT_60385 [Trichoplax adhaerens]EDV21034.1 hypothetical protein TRIADDRAFT_60385 [Trichoplax adhaerens]|eukprot:XP_002116364.1 hypothetical protein TRIADDRAFT_60385 [Trichoplax adhaerens]